MQRIALWIAFWAFLSSAAQAAWRDVYEAAVRVERPGAAGSGVVFHADDRFVWVLTNAHVVDRSLVVRVVPFQQGRQLPPATGRVTLRVMQGNLDAAVVRVARSAWPGRVRVVPLSLDVPQPGEEIVTVGCPRADWPALWHGRVLRVAYPVFYFWPGRSTQLDLMSGRSGSAVCDAQGTRVIGLFTWSIRGQGAGQCIRYVVQQLWRTRHQVPLPAGESKQRLPEHLKSVEAWGLGGGGGLRAWRDEGGKAGGCPKAQTGQPSKPPSPHPLQSPLAGPLVPVRWEPYRKPDGTLPQTRPGSPPGGASGDCWPRLPWRPGRPPQPSPSPSPGEGGPVLPELPGGGSSDPSLAEKVRRLETRLSSLETTLQQLRAGYEDIRRQWPQVREILLSSDLPQAKELVQRIEQLDGELRQAVAEAENAARQAAQAETRGLKERVAELLGRVDAMGELVQTVSAYAQARREGADPRGAVAAVLEAKLQSLESRLMNRVENLDRGSLAAALTYVGVPSLAATIIAFFLAGALRRRGDDVLQLLFGLLQSKFDHDTTKKGK